MVFWIGILIAVAFAYSSVKLGLYQAWTTLFNVLISAYLGVRLGPTVQDFVPMSSQYCGTLAVLATGVGTFLVLHGISYAFLIGQFEVTFPRAVNRLGSAVMGFLAGFLICSFAALVVCTTPFCENKHVKDIGFGSKGFEEARMQSYLVWWCNLVDKLVVSADNQPDTEQAIKDLLTKSAAGRIRASRLETSTPAEVNEPSPGHPEGESATEPSTVIPP